MMGRTGVNHSMVDPSNIPPDDELDLQAAFLSIFYRILEVLDCNLKAFKGTACGGQNLFIKVRRCFSDWYFRNSAFQYASISSTSFNISICFYINLKDAQVQVREVGLRRLAHYCEYVLMMNPDISRSVKLN